LADNLGSVRDVVNTSSTVVDHIVYNSFGQVAYQSNSAIAHWAGFAGYHTDANTGLDDADHRWYDPHVGRWTSEDPLGFGGGDTNVSRYVANGATNAADPAGLVPDANGNEQPPSPTNPLADYPAPWDPSGGPNGTGGWSWQYLLQFGLTSPQAIWAMQHGCYGLAQVMTGAYDAWVAAGSLGPVHYPAFAPGAMLFANQQQAAAYMFFLALHGQNSMMFAYQFQDPMLTAPRGGYPAFTPQFPGQINPALVPAPGSGQNWCTYQWSPTSMMWYWAWMNHGATSNPTPGNPHGSPATVSHRPTLDPPPKGGGQVIGVIVRPPSPPTPPPLPPILPFYPWS